MLIKNLLEDLGADNITATNPIPVQNVSCAALRCATLTLPQSAVLGDSVLTLP